LQIAGGHFLSRDLSHIGHVEVFLPADNGVVCAAKDQDIGIRLDFENQGRELLLDILVNVIDIAHQF